MNYSHFESITHSCSKRHDTRRYLKWSETIIGYFRVFGCVGHILIPDAKRSKLEDKRVTCVLFGVSSESKSYRMFYPTTYKIIVSHNVAFEEDCE